MRILILRNQTGEELGLYSTKLKGDVEDIVQECFKKAYNTEDTETKGDVRDVADELLEKRGIKRIFAQEICIDENHLDEE